jgi:hypothetical protein
VKALVLIVILALVCVVLFVVGAFSPKRSRRLQRSVDRLSGKGEAKADRHAGRAGDLTEEMLERMRRAADASARKGRDVHKRITS